MLCRWMSDCSQASGSSSSTGDLHLGQRVGQVPAQRLVGALRRLAHQHALDRDLELEDVVDVLEIEHVDAPALARLVDQQTLLLQPLERLAYRRPADVELLGDLRVVDELARLQPQVDDLVADVVVGLLLEGGRFFCHGVSPDSGCRLGQDSIAWPVRPDASLRYSHVLTFNILKNSILYTRILKSSRQVRSPQGGACASPRRKARRA